MKQRYKVEAFVWIYGERVVKKCAYTYAFSAAQAVLQVFKGRQIPNEWEIAATEV